MAHIDTTVAKLCLMILDDDISVVPVLADRLEELGHPRAAHIRQIFDPGNEQ